MTIENGKQPVEGVAGSHERRLYDDHHYRLVCYMSGVTISNEFLPFDVDKVARRIYGEPWRRRLKGLSDKIREKSDEQLRQHLLETENIFLAAYDPVVDDWWATELSLKMIEAIAAEDFPLVAPKPTKRERKRRDS